jgi:hypothetical protein
VLAVCSEPLSVCRGRHRFGQNLLSRPLVIFSLVISDVVGESSQPKPQQQKRHGISN